MSLFLTIQIFMSILIQKDCLVNLLWNNLNTIFLTISHLENSRFGATYAYLGVKKRNWQHFKDILKRKMISWKDSARLGFSFAWMHAVPFWW
jgi:hypothetical protein